MHLSTVKLFAGLWCGPKWCSSSHVLIIRAVAGIHGEAKIRQLSNKRKCLIIVREYQNIINFHVPMNNRTLMKSPKPLSSIQDEPPLKEVSQIPGRQE